MKKEYRFKNTKTGPIIPDNTTMFKKWIRWKLSSPLVSDEDKELCTAINDLISQVGTYKALLNKSLKFDPASLFSDQVWE